MAAEDGSTIPNLMRFGDRYGPYAFGVTSLLIIWSMIVSPQLEATKVNYESHQRVVDQMRDIVGMQRELAATLKDAILAMERITNKTTQHVAPTEATTTNKDA